MLQKRHTYSLEYTHLRSLSLFLSHTYILAWIEGLKLKIVVTLEVEVKRRISLGLFQKFLVIELFHVELLISSCWCSHHLVDWQQGRFFILRRSETKTALCLLRLCLACCHCDWWMDNERTPWFAIIRIKIYT